jgi:hypothetical protein
MLTECGASALAAVQVAVMVRLVTADVDVGYFWHEAPVPGSLEIVKVYGFLFCPDTARSIRAPGGIW